MDSFSCWLAAAGLLVLALWAQPDHAAAPPADGVGESIYLRGMLSPERPLEGVRGEGGISTKGAEAACVNCHQRSGLGSREGSFFIPPVTADYLFHERSHSGGDPQRPDAERMHDRAPYTVATLGRAIREGVDPDGRQLSYLMPRYALGDSDLEALIGYLRKLVADRSPGVTEGVLHFATIVTPDADPAKRSGVLDVLQHYVTEYNASPIGPPPSMWTSGKSAAGQSTHLAQLRWQLHVWQLTGSADTWRAQLEKHLHDEPVFAVLSGLGGSRWGPVHEFCEQNALPCLFPNVEVPVVEEGAFYSLYFSKGVLLEAELIANRLAAQGKLQELRFDQLYRRGDSGEPAAQALGAALRSHGVTVHDHALAPGDAGAGLGTALHAAAKAQVLVLWLRAGDLAALGAPPAAAQVYVSGLMGGLEDAPIPGSWRDRTLLALPFDVPDRRGARLDFPLGWFRFRHIPVVAKQVQVDTFLACSLVSQVVRAQMANSYVRAYLIEQLQGTLEQHLITGYYPHLALSYHERFASRGGYIAHFTSTARGTRLVADGDWTVP